MNHTNKLFVILITVFFLVTGCGKKENNKPDQQQKVPENTEVAQNIKSGITIGNNGGVTIGNQGGSKSIQHSKLSSLNPNSNEQQNQISGKMEEAQKLREEIYQQAQVNAEKRKAEKEEREKEKQARRQKNEELAKKYQEKLERERRNVEETKARKQAESERQVREAEEKRQREMDEKEKKFQDWIAPFKSYTYAELESKEKEILSSLPKNQQNKDEGIKAIRFLMSQIEAQKPSVGPGETNLMKQYFYDPATYLKVLVGEQEFGTWKEKITIIKVGGYGVGEIGKIRDVINATLPNARYIEGWKQKADAYDANMTYREVSLDELWKHLDEKGIAYSYLPRNAEQ